MREVIIYRMVKSPSKFLIFVQFVLLYWPPVQGTVQFNFSTSELGISEGGDLPSQLSIVKTGVHEEGRSITLRVNVTPVTPNENDYVPNEDHAYIFTREINELPIATQLLTDRSGEGIESFIITLLPPEGAGNDDVMIVPPSSVTVIIIDDDSVVIGFSDSNTSVSFTERGPDQTVCVNVKPEGLELDPFDSVPLNIVVTGLQNEVTLPTGSLTFSKSMMEKCKTISVVTNEVSDGTRSGYLVLTEASGTSVPVEVYPSRIPVTIIDDDVTNFTLTSHTSLTLLEGERRTGAVVVVKTNNTVLTYNVTLTVGVLTSSADSADLAISGTYTMAPSITEVDVPLEPRDNSKPSEKPKKFQFNISRVEAIDAVGVFTSVQGMPVMITVYDNDFKVGFTESEIALLSDGHNSNHTVCVEIFGGVTTDDIMPGLNIDLNLTVSPASTHGGTIQLGLDGITFNNTNKIVCFEVAIMCNLERSDPGVFILELVSTNNESYSISFQQQNVTFSLSISPVQRPLSDGAIVAIVVTLILAAIVVSLIVIVGTVFAVIGNRKKDAHTLDNSRTPEEYNPVNRTRQEGYIVNNTNRPDSLELNSEGEHGNHHNGLNSATSTTTLETPLDNTNSGRGLGKYSSQAQLINS